MNKLFLSAVALVSSFGLVNANVDIKETAKNLAEECKNVTEKDSAVHTLCSELTKLMDGEFDETAVSDLIKKFQDLTGDKAKEVAEDAKDAAAKAATTLTETVKPLVENANEALENVVEKGKELAKDAAENPEETLKTVTEKAKEVGASVVKSVTGQEPMEAALTVFNKLSVPAQKQVIDLIISLNSDNK